MVPAASESGVEAGDPGLWGASHWSGYSEESPNPGGEDHRGGGQPLQLVQERSRTQWCGAVAIRPGRTGVTLSALPILVGGRGHRSLIPAAHDNRGMIGRTGIGNGSDLRVDGRLKALLSSEFPSAVPLISFLGDLELVSGLPEPQQPRLRTGAEA